jgi:hypothetical protein
LRELNARRGGAPPRILSKGAQAKETGRQERINQIIMKLRSDSTLAKLTEHQLTDLFDWCGDLSFEEVIKKAAQPAPEGLGLKLHKTTLVRFFREETKRRHAHDLAQLAMTDSDSDPSSLNPGQSGSDPSSLANLIRASRGEFAHAVYELSLAATEPENFDRLERALHHLDIVAIKRDQLKLHEQELELARERLALDRENFEYNAAGAVMEHIVPLRAIDKRTDIDEDDKIKLARKICFGRVPLSPHTPRTTNEPTLPTAHSRLDTLGHTKPLPRAALSTQNSALSTQRSQKTQSSKLPV